MTYSGNLTQWGSPVEGEIDLRVRLYESPEAAHQLGSELEFSQVVVEEGAFAITLELPNGLVSEDLWLEIDLRRSHWRNSFVTLQTRQRARIRRSATTRASAPTGAVVFFDLPNCPSGWREFAPAQGRAIVGLSPFGTLGATVGEPLGDMNEILHRHRFTQAWTSEVAGAHRHSWARTDGVNGQRWLTYDQSGSEILVTTWGNGIGNEGSGLYPLSRDNRLNRVFWTDLDGDHSHELATGLTDFETGSLPYVQLLPCIKD